MEPELEDDRLESRILRAINKSFKDVLQGMQPGSSPVRGSAHRGSDRRSVKQERCEAHRALSCHKDYKSLKVSTDHTILTYAKCRVIRVYRTGIRYIYISRRGKRCNTPTPISSLLSCFLVADFKKRYTGLSIICDADF